MSIVFIVRACTFHCEKKVKLDYYNSRVKRSKNNTKHFNITLRGMNLSAIKSTPFCYNGAVELNYS